MVKGQRKRRLVALDNRFRLTETPQQAATRLVQEYGQGGVHWGVIASLVETAKLNAVDPQTYLADVLTRLVNRHPASQIDQLMPWAYAQANRVA
jgi:hypothetical protein